MLEAEDDAEVFQALLRCAEDWLRGQGMRRALGPFNLSINEECGLLVDGFEHRPSMLMGHARPYYAAQLEALGYRKRSEEHTSELQSLMRISYAVFCLKKKKKTNYDKADVNINNKNIKSKPI